MLTETTMSNGARSASATKRLLGWEMVFRYVCPACGDGIRRKLCDDLEGGIHTYVWA